MWARLVTLSSILVPIVEVFAQSCSETLEPSYPAPSVAPGYEARLVAQGLNEPRGLIFDSSGHLLVLQQGRGVTKLSLRDDGGTCVSVEAREDIVENDDLNHGIELSSDGRTLYASSAEAVFAWSYDPASGTTASEPRILVEGMANPSHTTRTILVSRKAPGILLVSRGSASNVDPEAADIESGHCQIKAFTTDGNTSPYDYAADGDVIGWGLRNSVGVAEDPVTGGIWSVENSVDQFQRSGEDIHQDNPGEELNFHGYLNGTTHPNQGSNFGYPSCFAAWDVDSIPDNEDVEVGVQVAINDPEASVGDDFCAEDTVPPRITFQAHMAPLDIKFNTNGSEAWITFHGSWNRDEPIGYKLSLVRFSEGSPVEPSTSREAAIDIMTNVDTSQCPDNCFRPVGLAWDSEGRLFMSSDSTGEIYVVVRSAATSDADTSGSSVDTAPSATATSQAGAILPSIWALSWLITAAAAFALN